MHSSFGWLSRRYVVVSGGQRCLQTFELVLGLVCRPSCGLIGCCHCKAYSSNDEGCRWTCNGLGFERVDHSFLWGITLDKSSSQGIQNLVFLHGFDPLCGNTAAAGEFIDAKIQTFQTCHRSSDTAAAATFRLRQTKLRSHQLNGILCCQYSMLAELEAGGQSMQQQRPRGPRQHSATASNVAFADVS